LALVAMAQKNMDLTIENLTAHREGKGEQIPLSELSLM
jgi:hypothetical protein